MTYPVTAPPPPPTPPERRVPPCRSTRARSWTCRIATEDACCVPRTAQEQRRPQSYAARLPHPPGSRPSSACGQRPTAGRSVRALGVTDAMTCDNEHAVRTSSSRGPHMRAVTVRMTIHGARRRHDRQFRARGLAAQPGCNRGALTEGPVVQAGGGPTTCTPKRRPAETMAATSNGAGVSSSSSRGELFVTNHSSTPDGA